MTSSLFEYYREILRDLRPVGGAIARDAFTTALTGEELKVSITNELEARYRDLESKYAELEGASRWLHAQIVELESTPWIFRRRATKGLTGYRRLVAELSNTLSTFLWNGRISDKEDAGRDAEIVDYPRLLSVRQRRLAGLMAENAFDLRHENRILVDITSTLSCEFLSGIQRVCWEFCRAAAPYHVVPVFLHEGEVYAFHVETSKIQPVRIRKGEMFFWPDASWEYWEEVQAVMRKVEGLAGSNVFLVYDLIPIILPNFTTLSSFRSWLNCCVLHADAAICISQAVSADLTRYLSTYYHRIKMIGWSHLGCDLPSNPGRNLSEDVRLFVEANRSFFLSVGTIEPRKGYPIALDAFEELWSETADVGYVIVGRYGWLAESIRARIENHPDLGRRLFWCQSATDADLDFLYDNARALVYPSINEGFGLPAVEAASKRLPVIASDIPVFREIGQNKFSYFEPGNSRELAARLLNALAEKKADPEISTLSWNEATQRLIEMIRDDSYQLTIDKNGAFSSRLADTSVAAAELHVVL